MSHDAVTAFSAAATASRQRGSPAATGSSLVEKYVLLGIHYLQYNVIPRKLIICFFVTGVGTDWIGGMRFGDSDLVFSDHMT